MDFEPIFKDGYSQTDLTMLIEGEENIQRGPLTMYTCFLTPNEGKTQVCHTDLVTTSPRVKDKCCGTEDRRTEFAKRRKEHKEKNKQIKTVLFRGYDSVK